jgi:hypothetical protein
MCSNESCRVEVRPDGVIVEDHVLTDPQMVTLQSAINDMLLDVYQASLRFTYIAGTNAHED